MAVALLLGALLGAAAQETARADCHDIIAFQVLLDRSGFSPGEIDGLPGANTTRALTAFQQSKGLRPTGAPDCPTRQALGAEAVLADYTITPDDASGPFAESIPEDLVEQAQLPALGYQSILERLGERFHAAPSLLEKLNPGARFAAGDTIKVPAVEPFVDTVKPAVQPKAAAAAVRVEVSREGSLQVFRADGSLAMFAPVTSGSEHDPLPLGQWKVLSVHWMPPFNYNPDLFWDADPSHTKVRIKPGPNNPVGVAWIDIDKDHYGLHGTPEPSKVGHAQSHGCVRLTNWDAARLAALVGPGTIVVFK
jgi:lipoprotein-anchoring transpeptidase ErfK/SrfK